MITDSHNKKWIAGTPRLYVDHAIGRQECPGCQYPVIQRLFLESIDELGLGDQAIAVITAACGYTFALTCLMDAIFPNHGQGTDVATAIKRLNPNNFVFAVEGDGDCTAIGAGALIAAAGRAEKFTVIMLHNAHFAMTGGQMAPTSVMGQVTTTSHLGRDPSMGYPLHLAETLVSVRGVAYSARGAVNNPANYQRTKKFVKAAFQKQIDDIGFSFLEIISACPVGWHMTPKEALKWIENELIKEFPLGEYKNADTAGT